MFWRSRKNLIYIVLNLYQSNCNTGISFHGVVQNIFTLSDGIKITEHYKYKTLFQIHERADFQYFTVLCLILAPKETANLQYFYFIHNKKPLQNEVVMN